MHLSLHRQQPGDTDWEMLWGVVLATVAVMGALWLSLNLPTPQCVIYRFSGWPCLSCGGTRTARALLHGDLLAALVWNPLVAAGLIAAAAYMMYAILVCVMRWPRIRITGVTPRWAMFFRLSIIGLLASNWIYLVFRFSKNH